MRDALAKKLSINSANFTLKVVRGALNRAVKERLIEFNEAMCADMLRRRSGKTKERRRPFTMGQLCLILAGFYTGLRLGDIAMMTCGPSVDTPADISDGGQVRLEVAQARARTHPPQMGLRGESKGGVELRQTKILPHFRGGKLARDRTAEPSGTGCLDLDSAICRETQQTKTSNQCILMRFRNRREVAT